MECTSQQACTAIKVGHGNGYYIRSIDNEDDNKESTEPDYDYDDENSDKEGEEKQEEQTQKPTITINRAF